MSPLHSPSTIKPQKNYSNLSLNSSLSCLRRKNMYLKICPLQDYIQSFVEQYNRSINDRINIDYLGNGSQEYFQFFQNRLVKFIQSQGRKLEIKNQKEEDDQNNEIIQDHLTIKEFMSFSQFINRNFFSNQNQQQFSQIFIKENSAKNNGKFIKQWKITRENIKQSENDQQQEKSRGFLQEKYQRLEIMQQLMEKQCSTFKQLLAISLGYFYILYDQQIKKLPSKVQADDQKKIQNIQKKIFIIKVLMCNIILKIIERYQKMLLNMKNIFSAILSESQAEQYLILNEQSNSFSQNKSKNLNVKMKTIFIKFRQYFQKIQTSDIKNFILISTKESDRQSKNISNQKTISSSLGASFYSNFINKIMDVVSSTVNLNLKVKEVESQFFQQAKQNQIKSVRNLNQKKVLTPISWLLQNIYNLENSQIQNGQPQVKSPEKQVSLLTIIQTITKKLLTAKKFQNPLHKLIMVLQSSHNISTVSKIIKFFSFIYNEAIKDFSQLLYFITETIRYDLSKIFKNIDQKIRERAYKLSDSEIVYLKDLNFFLDFDGSLNLLHYSSNQRQFYSNLYFGRQFEPFRLKQAIKTQKMKEDVFLKICKSTLKDLKFLIQKYTQYKSGKIVHNDKNHSTRRLSKLQAQLIQSQRRKFSSNENYYDNSLQKEDFTIINKGRLFVQVGINVNLDLVKKQRKNSLKSISSRKNSIQFQNLVHAVFQKQQQLHRISQKIQQTHNQHNKNNEILKSNNETLRKIYQENSQLIKINQWYEEQLRLHQDKQTELEKTISELIDINRKRDELKHRFKVQSLTVNQIIFPSQNQGGRFSKDSNRTRRRSSFNGRFLKDLTKISPQNQKHNDFILPALPHTLNAANYILPPPPPLISSFSLPPPPPLLQLTPPPLPPFLNLVPPPLLHQGLRKSIGKNSTNKKNQHQFKTVGWNMVDLTSIRDSFWQEVGEVQFNKEDLIKNFSKKPSTSPVETFKILQQKKQKKTLLKPDRVKNVQIGLKKVKLTYKGIESLQNIVYEYDQNYLQIDKIECLLNILPTQQQKQSYSEILVQEGTQEQWTLADFFLLTISKIESYQERLKAIRFKLQFAQISEDFFIKINNLKDFLIDLRTDQFLQVFLEYMLNIGNFLNSNSNKGGAYGFRLQSIPKTYSLIGQDKSTSLFDFILKALSQKNLTLFNSLKENQKLKMIVSINILEQDLNSYIKDCAAIQQIIIYSRRQGDNSSKYLLPFYISCQEEINIMKKIVKQVKQIFEDILSFYCEKMECEELINFIKDFRNRVRQYMKKNKLMGSGGNNNFRFSIA